jgi:hypothetical protein
MHPLRKATATRCLSFPLLALTLATVLPLGAGPAFARQCPRGQILRVSKNICVAKGAAVPGHTYFGPTFRGPNKASPEPETQSADLEPAAGAADMERALAAAPAKKARPPAVPLSPSASPYGELNLESFVRR